MWNCYFESWATHKRIMHVIAINVVGAFSPKNNPLEVSFMGRGKGTGFWVDLLKIAPKVFSLAVLHSLTCNLLLELWLLSCFIPFETIHLSCSDCNMSWAVWHASDWGFRSGIAQPFSKNSPCTFKSTTKLPYLECCLFYDMGKG